MALAGKSVSVDIPKPRAGLAVPGRNVSRAGQPAMLPTPPNSISPNLAPQYFKNRGARHPRSPSVDSDIDLGDIAEDVEDHGQTAGQDLDSVGAITPGMLAKYHLPSVLLDQGPLPIRHVMGYLTTFVPGFSRIPPAKARRLVVAALESQGRGAGLQDDVVFEKVGWGRWEARRRGEPSRTHQPSPPSSLSNSFPHRGLPIPGNSAWKRNSLSGDSAFFSYSETGYCGGEDLDMLEDEADKMSLDGDAHDYCSSEAPEEDIQDEDWGEDDITDEEDWAHIGAAALRARSLNGGGGFVGRHAPRKPPSQLRGGGPASLTLAKAAPPGIATQQCGFSVPDAVVNGKEERAAVEALLRLGSM